MTDAFFDPTRISDKDGHDATTLHVTTPTPVRAVRAYEGSDRRAGHIIARAGLVCGLDRCGPDARALELGEDEEITFGVTQDEVPEEGWHDVDVTAHTGEEWT